MTSRKREGKASWAIFRIDTKSREAIIGHKRGNRASAMTPYLRIDYCPMDLIPKKKPTLTLAREYRNVN